MKTYLTSDNKKPNMKTYLTSDNKKLCGRIFWNGSVQFHMCSSLFDDLPDSFTTYAKKQMNYQRALA